MAKILVVEDEQSIRMMLQYDLKQAGHDVDVSDDGKVGFKQALSNSYDIIVLDLLLPNMDGREIARKLKHEGISSYIIMLSALDDEFDKIRGFEHGADDYMTKPFSPRELSAKINAILRREQPKNKTSKLHANGIEIDIERYTVRVNQDFIKLTHKEFELLVYFIKNQNRALTRDQILNAVWGYDYFNDSRVVDVHVSKIREKIEASSKIIETIRGVGYIMK